MGKELPWFKFEPNTWSNGNIQMCSRDSKGLFMDLCALYWPRLGELPYALALQKLCNGDESAFKELLKYEIFGVVNDQIVIQFLDEQLSERDEISEERRKAAKKRWSDANALQNTSKGNARREEKRREEKRINDVVVATAPTIQDRSNVFYSRLIPFVEKYGKDMIRDFYEYWIEPSKTGKKLRFEGEKFFDIARRLGTWNSRNNSGYKKPKGGFVQ